MLPRDKKGCFRRLKEIKRREISAVNCKTRKSCRGGWNGHWCSLWVTSCLELLANCFFETAHASSSFSAFQVEVGEYYSILKWPIYPRYSFTLLDQRDQRKDEKEICAYFEPQRITRPHADRNLGKGARRFVLQEDIRDSSRNPWSGAYNSTVFV